MSVHAQANQLYKYIKRYMNNKNIIVSCTYFERDATSS